MAQIALQLPRFILLYCLNGIYMSCFIGLLLARISLKLIPIKGRDDIMLQYIYIGV